MLRFFRRWYYRKISLQALRDRRVKLLNRKADLMFGPGPKGDDFKKRLRRLDHDLDDALLAMKQRGVFLHA